MSEYLLHSNRTWIDKGFKEATLHISDGVITDVISGLHRMASIPFEDFADLILMPGIIDAHVHINEPGRTDWEGFHTATKAAALGGITTLIEMPLNASPVTTSAEAFLIKQKAAEGKLHVNCGFYGGVIPDNDDDIEGLIKAGVFGIKGFLIHSGIDEFPNTTKEQLERICPILKRYDIPLLLHCELETEEILPRVTDPQKYEQYLNSRPPSWELSAIELAIGLQKKFNCRVHIVHLSAADALETIKARRKQSRLLTVETCAHYLYFVAEEIPNAAPVYKCAPPIRGRSNNQRLWAAVGSGDIDFLTSDHSPAPPDIKNLDSGDLFTAWGGIAGLQFTLPALWRANRTLSLEEFIPLLTSHPARFLGLDHRKGQIARGFDADITIWDESASIKITADTIAHRHKESPYLDEELQGKVHHCMVNGEFVVRDGQLHQLNEGKLLLKSNSDG